MFTESKVFDTTDSTSRIPRHTLVFYRESENFRQQSIIRTVTNLNTSFLCFLLSDILFVK